MTPKQHITRLKKKTKWSWEKMNREFVDVMGYEGVSHTTLYRLYMSTPTPNSLTERYVSEAVQKINVRLMEGFYERS